MSNTSFMVMSWLLALHHRLAGVTNRLHRAGIEEGQTVLDFGCGPGHYAAEAARMVGEKGMVYALDIHPLAIKAVRGKALKGGLNNISTILSDRDTGLADETIDVVLLYDTIHAIGDKQALLSELHRVMKPRGVLSVWVEHTKVEDVVDTIQREGLFSLKDRDARLLNFEKRAA